MVGAMSDDDYTETEMSYPLCPGCGAPLDENHVGSCYGLGACFES